jgi:hypothetical protein
MIVTRMDTMERAGILANFSDTEGNIQFLLLSSAVSSAGPDLHSACHNGIFTGIVRNAGMLFQDTGRLFRIGQVSRLPVHHQGEVEGLS